MLDFPFNHTAPDVVLGQKGIDIFAAIGNPDGWSASDKIQDRSHSFSQPMEGRVLRHTVIQLKVVVILQLCPTETTSANGAMCAMSFRPICDSSDRLSGENSSRATVRNESDSFDYSSLVAETIGVWQYFGEVLPYWIIQSGHRGYNSSPSDGAIEIA